jgi:hypothetical protein
MSYLNSPLPLLSFTFPTLIPGTVSMNIIFALNSSKQDKSQ